MLHLLMLMQIQLYFNRNVRLFTARTTTVTCIHVLMVAEGVRSNQSNPPRYGPDHGANRKRIGLYATYIIINFRRVTCLIPFLRY